MKIAIIYKSLTGNTKQLALAIKDVVEEEVVYVGEPKEGIDADLYFIGSWTDKGTCEETIAEYLQTMENKKIAYFGTAGFGGSEEYYQSIFSRVKTNVKENNEVLGFFLCQGKMPEGVKKRYFMMLKDDPENKRLQASLANYEKALTHPDATDVQNIQKWVESLIEEI